MGRGRLGEARTPGFKGVGSWEAIPGRWWEAGPQAGLQASCTRPIVQLNFTYKTEIQRQYFKMAATETETKQEALLSARPV